MRFKGKKNKTPLSAAYRKSVKTFAPLKFRERKSFNDTIGEADRDSTAKKPASAHSPTTPMPAGGTPRRGASINPKVTAPSPTVASSAPGQSSARLISVPRLSGTFHTVSATASAAMGRLTKNTQR